MWHGYFLWHVCSCYETNFLTVVRNKLCLTLRDSSPCHRNFYFATWQEILSCGRKYQFLQQQKYFVSSQLYSSVKNCRTASPGTPEKVSVLLYLSWQMPTRSSSSLLVWSLINYCDRCSTEQNINMGWSFIPDPADKILFNIFSLSQKVTHNKLQEIFIIIGGCAPGQKISQLSSMHKVGAK